VSDCHRHEPDTDIYEDSVMSGYESNPPGRRNHVSEMQEKKHAKEPWRGSHFLCFSEKFCISFFFIA
jgi:hypothetical protein